MAICDYCFIHCGVSYCDAERRDEMSDEMYQSIVITLDDDSTHVFTGKACVYPGDNKKLRGVKFFEPKEMPEGCKWEEIKNENKA